MKRLFVLMLVWSSLALAGEDAVFRKVLRKPGDDGAKSYRIPGLATTPKGTLIAVFDIRWNGAGDLPADIDVGAMRSTNNGATWSPMLRVMDFDKTVDGSRGNGVGDPCIIVDQMTGDILVAALWSKGDHAWFHSGAGMTPDETGQLVISRSTDDGQTWSAPVSITEQVKKPQWRLMFQGPGRGIQLKDGTLVMPAQYKDEGNKPHSCFIHSSDHGTTWKLEPAPFPDQPITSECQIAECQTVPGLLMTMRDETHSGKRAWALWENGSDFKSGHWTKTWHDLPDPTCQASLISYPGKGLLFSNPSSSTKRSQLTVRFSADDGKTWNAGSVIEPGGSMYSCMTVLRNAQIGMLYENKDGLTFARFPIQLVSKPDAALSLAPVFTNHMVLQRDKPVPVWGRADPEASVKVSFGGQSKTVTADAKGQWKASLDPMPASAKSDTLTVEATHLKSTAHWNVYDVLVGEVWIAAGQSNMEWTLAKEAHAIDQLPQANLPLFRLMNMGFAGQNASGKAFNADVAARHTPETFYHGEWQVSSPASAGPFSAVAWYFGKELVNKIKVPVGIIHLAVGGSPTEAWIRREALAADPQLAAMVKGDWLKNEALGEWCRQRGQANLGALIESHAAVPSDDLGPNHPFKPCFLWDSGMARLKPLAMRGVIWYQGESNSLDERRMKEHERLFPLLVNDWRAQWQAGDFPFYYCQLSSIRAEGYKSQFWPEFRDGQRRMLSLLPNMGMAVTSDIGNPTNVHPTNKLLVGERLARWALAKTYGQKVETSGPLPRSLKREGASLVVAFDHGAGLRTSDGKPVASIEVAGADGVYHAADAVLSDGSAKLSSHEVAEPVTARYGWQPYSLGNLVNGDGLPASTFELKLPTAPSGGR